MSRMTVLAMVLLAACAAAGQELVPFVIPPRPDGKSLLATSSEAFGVTGPRIVVRDGRFARDGKRVRLWGVNTCFGASFPPHDDAPHIARRLAEAGVNSVRLHHMDTARWPRGIWTRDGKAIEPQALDRLDFFVNELAKRGICINLNLHVGRAHSRFLGIEQPNTSYDKIVGIFTPKLVDAQKRYARQLLTRVNTYRKVRYADDPAVAFVEITNEDSLFMWSAARDLRALPPSYEAILAGKYNDWLKDRYKTTDRLAGAWAKGAEPLGENVLANPALAAAAGGKAPAGWAFEQHAGCAIDTRRATHAGRDALLADIRKSDATSWHIQVKQGGIKLKAGRYYTITATLAAAKPRRITCGVSMDHEPWGSLGLSQSLSVTPAWKTFRMGFVAKDDDNARLSFSLSDSDVDVYFAEVRLQPGGIEGLTKGERLEDRTVRLFSECESDPRVVDRMLFLAETEKAYFDEMYRYVKRDLGCKALVTGTIVFGPLGLWAQSGMDFIDGHAYWQHPRFPGRPWDGNNWLVAQKAMVDSPAGATLFRLAAQRLAGKPYTVSEYNHPAPNDYQAECVPMLASFAAAQDWDGIWLFTYANGGGDWTDQRLRGFFDMQMNPAKWGFVRAGAAMFRDGGIDPLTAGICPSLGPLPDTARLHRTFDRDMAKMLGSFLGNKLDWSYMTRRQVAWHFGGMRIGKLTPVEGKGSITWAQSNRTGGQYVAAGPGARAFVGQAGRMSKVTKGELTLESPKFAVVTMTALDRKPLGDSRSVLVAACGRCENVGMVFAKDRQTVGLNWGRPPVQIEPVAALLRLPPGRWRCQALGPDGRPGADVELEKQADKSVLPLSPRHKTMWYLLTPVAGVSRAGRGRPGVRSP